MNKKIISILLCIFIVLSASTSFADGAENVELDSSLFTPKKSGSNRKFYYTNDYFLKDGEFYVKDSNDSSWNGAYAFDSDGYWIESQTVEISPDLIRIDGGHWQKSNGKWWYGLDKNGSDDEEDNIDPKNSSENMVLNWELDDKNNENRVFVDAFDYGKGYFQKDFIKTLSNDDYVHLGFDRLKSSDPEQPTKGSSSANTHITSYPQGSTKIKVGVIDTFFYEHEHYKNNIRGRYDAVNGVEVNSFTNLLTYYGRYENDQSYLHGTHVAGIVKNVAPNCELYLAAAGSWMADSKGNISCRFTDIDINRAYAWLISKGCRVINLSIGNVIKQGDGWFKGFDYTINAYKTFYTNYPLNNDGINIVISAGNEGDTLNNNRLNGVASLNIVSTNGVTVGNKRMDGNYSRHSNRGVIPFIDIYAPGEQIYSSYYNEDDYEHLSGTSMAAPFVTGAICRMLENNPNLTASVIKQKLHSTINFIDFNKLK